MWRPLALTMPGGHRVLETERIADRHHPLADPRALSESPSTTGSHRRRLVDLDQRDVGLRVAADHLGLVLVAVRELDDDLVGVLDDVVVGEDEPLVSMTKPEPRLFGLNGRRGIARAEEASKGSPNSWNGSSGLAARAPPGAAVIPPSSGVRRRRDVHDGRKFRLARSTKFGSVTPVVGSALFGAAGFSSSVPKDRSPTPGSIDPA